MAEINQLPVQETALQDTEQFSETESILSLLEASRKISQYSTTLIKEIPPSSEVEFGYYAELSEARNIEEFEQKIGKAIRALGFDEFSYFRATGGSGDPQRLVTISQEMIKNYYSEQFYLYDLILPYATTNTLPVFQSTFHSYIDKAPFDIEITRRMKAIYSLNKAYGYYWVTGYGTGGTFSGVAKVLKEQRPETKIILSEPINAQLIDSGTAQERTADGSPSGSHPAFQPHMIQGWTPDFIPQVLQESIDAKRFDQLIPVAAEDGIEASRMLARKEGIFTGISGGSTFAIALDIARNAAPGTVILCMLPDTGERYLSSPLFEDVAEDMNADELALSESTPGFHLNE